MKNIILIHGAWHGAWAWFKIIDQLENCNVLAIDLPGHGVDRSDIHDFTVEKAVEKVKSVMGYNEKYNIVAHSAGGIILSALCERYPEMINNAIYLAAFMVENGKSAMDYAMQDMESKVPAITIDNGDGTLAIKKDAVWNVFYNICKNTDIELAKLLLNDESAALLTTRLLLGENYNSVKKHYIKTMFDNAISPSMQDKMISNQDLESAHLIESDHSPFLSNHLLLSLFIKKILGEK